MKNTHDWRPSKYVLKGNILIASRNRREVAIPSRLMADLIAAQYDKALPIYAKGRLLDLGCGRAPLYLVYQRFVSDAICVDWGNSLHQNALLDLEWDLTQPLPYPSEGFDTVILSDVLEHIPNPEALWTEMARQLRPGGVIIMNVPFYYWLHESPYDFYRYTEFALRRFVDRAVLELVELHPIGGAPEIIADITSKCLYRVPRVGSPLAAFTQWITASFIRTKLGRRVSEATQDAFPFVYFLIARKPAAAKEFS